MSSTLHITTEPVDWARADHILALLKDIADAPEDVQRQVLAATLAIIRGGSKTIETLEGEQT
jgi:hypothetical protein